MKRKAVKRHKTRHSAKPHELIFVLSLAILVTLLGWYAYVQMFTFGVAASTHP